MPAGPFRRRPLCLPLTIRMFVFFSYSAPRVLVILTGMSQVGSGDLVVTRQTIGFIGLGDMGQPMAARLLGAGFPVVSHAHRRREAIETLKRLGLEEVANAHAVGDRADIVMTVVTDEAQTDTVLRGSKGALAAMAPGGAVIVMSTLAPKYCQDLAAEATSKEIAVLDCPVSGGTMGAAQGTLSMLTGGSGAAVEQCREALESMGRIFHCGDIGMGQVAKLANNSLLFGCAGLLWEARKLAKAHGMAPEALMEILGTSTGNTFMGENWDFFSGPGMWPHFISMIAKDTALAIRAGDDAGTPMLMTRQTRALDWQSVRDGPD